MTTPTIDTPEFRELLYTDYGIEPKQMPKLISHIDAKIAEAVKACPRCAAWDALECELRRQQA